MTIQYETRAITRHGGSMSVSLMHQWHDSCVGEWFLTPSLWLWSACEWVRGEWMHPRSVICYLISVIIICYLVNVAVCAIHVLHNPLRSPLCLYLIFWGLPSGLHMRRLSVIIWSVLGTWLKYWILCLHLNLDLNLNW